MRRNLGQLQKVSACILAIKTASSGIAEYCKALDNFNTCLCENQPNAEQCENVAGPIIDTIVKEATAMNPQSQCYAKAITDNVDYTQLQRLCNRPQTNNVCQGQ